MGRSERTSSRTTGPRAFLELAARAKAAGVLVFVVLHCFAGQPREGDVEDWLHRWGEQLGILFLVQSVDVACQPEWDLRCPELIALLLEAIGSGLIDFILGDPRVQRGRCCASWREGLAQSDSATGRSGGAST